VFCAPLHLLLAAGHQAVRLAPKQQHTITVALSSADCAARQQESGIMQQLLLLIFAVPLGSAASQALAAIHGVAMTDVFGSAARAGPVLAAQAGLLAAGALAGSYRLFVVVRRVTVALIDRPVDLAAQLLDVDAKPFISGAAQLEGSNRCAACFLQHAKGLSVTHTPQANSSPSCPVLCRSPEAAVR
jgi:hypothetical protein